MTERWSRRTLLAALGTAAVAGCLSDGDPGSGAGNPGDETSTTSPTPAATPTRSASPTDVHTVSGTDREPGTPSRTDTAASDPSTGTGAPTPDGTPTTPSSVESDWPVPGADAGRSNAVSGASGPTEAVAELWRFSAPAELSDPVLADGTLYVGSDEGRVNAVDAATGDRLWNASTGDTAGTPRVVDGRLFAPLASGIVALDLSNGDEQWFVETPNRRGSLVADHGVYWIDESGPTVVALSPADGSERWRTDLDDPWEPRIFASATRVFVSSGPYDNRYWRLGVEDGTQYNDPPRRGADFPAEQCHRAGTVYAVDAFFGNVDAKPVADGGVSWNQGVPPGGEAGGGLLAVGDERVYYTANMDDEPGLTALSVADGSEEWTADVTPAITARPAVGSDAVVLQTDDGLRSFDPEDGSRQWASGVDTGSGVVVADDLVFTTVGSAVVASRAP
jgi:outer membrane protein assembly factor BamB